MNMVAVSEEDDLEDVVNDPDSSKSTLSEWFVANQRFPAARQYTYCEFPNYYTWNNKEKAWEGRRRGTKIGRLRFIHPGVGDAFYLRMLLMVVRRATSYTDVRTYEDIVYNTFREACQQYLGISIRGPTIVNGHLYLRRLSSGRTHSNLGAYL